MNSAPSGLVWWCSRQRRRSWSRDLHGLRFARVTICIGSRSCTGRDLHELRIARVTICIGSRSCMGRGLHGGRISACSAFCIGCPARGGVPERRHVVVSGADERCGGLIVLAWRGFVVLAEQAAAHVAAAAQARAPVPTRVVASCLRGLWRRAYLISACASCGQVGCCELAHFESEGV